MVIINGVKMNIAGKTLSEYLASANYDQKKIAVECNGHIIPKAQYCKTILKSCDIIEIVSFVGGG